MSRYSSSRASRSPSPYSKGPSSIRATKLGKRLFVIGPKGLTEDEYRAAFEPYGKVDDIFMLRKGADSKGIVYITYSKLSEAALAIEELNGKPISDSGKYIKVMIASDKKGENVNDACEDERYHRLFIMTKRDDTEEIIREKFSEYGKIQDVTFVKNKSLCFVKFVSRYSAALALENVDQEYKPVFATPKNSERRRDGREPYVDDHLRAGVKRSRFDSGQSDGYYGLPNHGHYDHQPAYDRPHNYDAPRTFDRPPPSAPLLTQPSLTPIPAAINANNQLTECLVHVTVSASLSETNLRRLFDIVPGMCSLKFNVVTGIAYVRYAASEYANYAVEKLDGFEYPNGHCLIVRLSDQSLDGAESNADQLQRAAAILQQAGINPNSVLATEEHVITQAGDLERVPYCDFDVPSRQCTKPITTPIEKRLFIICQPSAIPTTYLKDIFCRFGDLIEIHMVRDRNFGYAKFASAASADSARDWLHMKSVAGCRLKVVDAEEKSQQAAAGGGAKPDEAAWQ